jgi:C4-type Zn-finger protein
MLENVKCPSCNEKIKKVTWRCKLDFFRREIDFCEVQCKKCSRRFVFTKIYNALVLTDEIRV